MTTATKTRRIQPADKPDHAADAVAKLASDFAIMIRDGIADPKAWRKSWKTIAGSGPWNVATKHHYTGGNWLILAIKAADNGWSHEWSTYKGWESLGATVSKGSKATWILAPSTFVTKEERAKAAAEGRDPRVMVTFRAVPIFNAAQVDGYTPKLADTITHDGLDTITEWLAATGAVIEHAVHHSPSYSPVGDHVQLPTAAQFDSAACYASTAAHEVGHWSGHKSRLDRKQLNVFGSADYAREELVAELASATIARALGYEVEPSLDHAHYLASWLQAIQSDPKALWSAASAAAKAVAFLDNLASLNLKPEEVE